MSPIATRRNRLRTHGRRVTLRTVREKSLRRIATVGVATALLAGAVTGPAEASGNRGWPVTPGSFGIMYGTTDGDTISAVRAWEAATWCRIQPSPDADMQANLASTLGAQLDAQRATGATSAIVGLGHPPAWVFNNAAEREPSGGPVRLRQQRQLPECPSPRTRR